MADIISAFEDRLATLTAPEFEVEEASSLACFEDAVLLFGISGEEFDQRDRLEIDGFELGRGREGRVCFWREFCGVRHCSRCSEGSSMLVSVKRV